MVAASTSKMLQRHIRRNLRETSTTVRRQRRMEANTLALSTEHSLLTATLRGAEGDVRYLLNLSAACSAWYRRESSPLPLFLPVAKINAADQLAHK